MNLYLRYNTHITYYITTNYITPPDIIFEEHRYKQTVCKFRTMNIISANGLFGQCPNKATGPICPNDVSLIYFQTDSMVFIFLPHHTPIRIPLGYATKWFPEGTQS